MAGDNQMFYAASEWGGLYKSTDGGDRWSFLSGHLPMATWDVEVDPGNTGNVYATSFYDGRFNSVSGIQVSHDAGVTWTHPPTATPPLAYNSAQARKDELTAFGIAVRPDATQRVYIGTNCGLAVSTNAGITWNFVDPTPATPASDVWDVVVQAGGPNGLGIIDICGDDRHRRSVDGGVNWTGGSPGLPAGQCSLAASPDESYVLIATAGGQIYETDDGGATAAQQLCQPGPPGPHPVRRDQPANRLRHDRSVQPLVRRRQCLQSRLHHADAAGPGRGGQVPGLRLVGRAIQQERGQPRRPG